VLVELPCQLVETGQRSEACQDFGRRPVVSPHLFADRDKHAPRRARLLHKRVAFPHTDWTTRHGETAEQILVP
jgi:hypothetical protein